MRTRYITAILSSLILSSSACETSKPVDASKPTAEASEATHLGETRVAQLLARAEQARDRKLQARPTFRAVNKLDAAAIRPLTDRVLLRAQLFGLPTEPGDGTHPRAPYAQLARFDRATNRIDYIQDSDSEELLDLALVAAIISAIDAQNFEAPDDAESWDAALAQEAAVQATVLFALADDLRGDNASLNLLAARPELATQLPYLKDWIAFEEPQDSHTERARSDALNQRVQGFVAREAWQLATALYRSSGWSGVELAGAMPPARSADIVRPDQWMSGAPVGQWSWPEDELESPRRGSVGPALISIWLEDVVDARLTQSLYAGYLSDAYRFFEPSDKAQPARFEWLTLWDSPSSASQVAAAFEQRLRARFRPDEDGKTSGRFSVFADGLTVGVIIEEGADSEAFRKARRTRAEHLLGAHTVELMPRAPLPTKFVPTRRDVFALSTAASTLEDRIWKAPDANLRMDLNALGDHWRVQQPDAGTLRWFASHDDGALLQLTVELDNPLGPSFESDAYQTKLGDALGASLTDSSLEFLKTSEPDATGALDEPGIKVRVRGQLNATERVLEVWQFHRGDLLITYSLQSPPKSFDAHLQKAAAILASSQKLHETTVDAAPSKPESANDGGSIEYQIED